VVVDIEEENGEPRMMVDNNRWQTQSCSRYFVQSRPPHAYSVGVVPVIDDTGKVGPCSLLRTSRFNLRLLAKEDSFESI
jgi:hypothetical protein